MDAQQHSSKFYNESARNLLTRPTKQALGVLMDFVETSPQYETAIENFLADKLNYLIVNEANMAVDSIDYLKQEGLGYCGFVIQNGHDTTPPVLPETLRQEPGVIASLREVVQIRKDASRSSSLHEICRVGRKPGECSRINPAISRLSICNRSRRRHSFTDALRQAEQKRKTCPD